MLGINFEEVSEIEEMEESGVVSRRTRIDTLQLTLKIYEQDRRTLLYRRENADPENLPEIEEQLKENGKNIERVQETLNMMSKSRTEEIDGEKFLVYRRRDGTMFGFRRV